ncbi:ABC-2 family transporter protein [Stieleria maiorica]|uniref:ABC-2 family transporter protein n=1 Tax=Stieleria maiorica TaxID=2795974 RepID=A0A5B9MGB2_9BACT|nr:hypothetical protein [Stieleria maiorica]QEF99539.1 ABC-2 family transporter protein [Stieleria maiorica]
MTGALINNRGLIWKEVRQLFPLAVALFAVGLVLMLVAQMSPDNIYAMRQYGRYIPLALPGLFAVGVAAMTVGQERDQKTILWLTSMPISPGRLIRIKLIVCASALGVMWIGCWALIKLEMMVGAFPDGFKFPLLPNLRHEASITQQVAFLSWHLHTFYIFVCGFYTSWRIKNSFASLIAIVPLAFAPFAVIHLGEYIRRAHVGTAFLDPVTSDLAALAVTLIATVIVGALGWRAAMRVLSPAGAEKESKDANRFSPYAVFGSSFGTSGETSRRVPDQPFRSTSLAIFRQSFGSNRLALWGIVFLIFAGVIGSTAGGLPYIGSSRSGGTLLVFSGLLGVCCLGVFAFTGDGKAERLRFFSDRGASPAKLWLGRHLLAVAVLGVASLLYLVVGVISKSVDSEDRHYLYIPPLTVVLLLAVYCYSISQWIGQNCRALSISLLLAPAATAASLLSAGAVISIGGTTRIGAPITIALAVVWYFVPLLATLFSMRTYADGVRGRKLFAKSVPALVLFVTIPLIPCTVEYVTYPFITNAQRISMAQRATKANGSVGMPTYKVSFQTPVGGRQLPVVNRTGDYTSEVAYDDRDFSAAHLANVYVDDVQKRGVMCEATTFDGILSLASFARVRFVQSPNDEAALAELNEWMDTMTKLTRRLRRSPRVIDQDHADAIVFWVADTLASPQYQMHLDRPAAQAAQELIADRQGWSDARRRAVLVSWYNWNEDRQSGSPADRFGGYSIDVWVGIHRGMLGQWLFRNHTIDSIAFHLLELLDAEEQGQSSLQQRKTLDELISGNNQVFEQGPYSDRARRKGASQAALLNTEIRSKYPGAQWFAAWEKELTQNAITD